jgi:glycosyltransferase involved in cell wall biosynthesis
MKVIHISNTDSGGAIELHAAFLENNIDSKMLVAKRDLGYASNIFEIGFKEKLKSIISNIIGKFLFRNTNKIRGMYSFPFWGVNAARNPLVKEADIIYLHFFAHSSFISLNGLKILLKTGKPVIMITRDLWPVTGGCHTPLDCKNYLNHCNSCPIFHNKQKPINFPKNQFQQKSKLYKKYKNLHFIGISEWNTLFINNNPIIGNNRARTIHNCINTEIFKPISKTEARNVLNLPEQGELIGFGARDISNPHKGGRYLKEALEILRESQETDLSIVTFGTYNSEDNFVENLTQYNLGHLKDRYTMALFYNAVDIYVNPTLAEAFGNTAAESLACGTPVVGFATGGLIDIVDNNEIGYLAKTGDSIDLANGIRLVLKKSNEPNLRLKCKEKSENNFSRKIIFEKHKNLWSQIKGNNGVMEILIIVYQTGNSSAGKVFEKITIGLAKAGNQVLMFCAKNDSTLTHQNLKIIEFDSGIVLPNKIAKALNIIIGRSFKHYHWEKRVFQESQKETKKFNPDLVFVLGSGGSESTIKIGYRLSKELKIPLAIHLVDPIPPPKGWENYEIYRKSLIRPIYKALKHASLFSINTPEMLEFQSSNVDFELKSKSFVLPDPVFEGKLEFKNSPKELVFSYIGSFYGPRKPDSLIKGFIKFLEIRPDAKLHIYGNNNKIMLSGINEKQRLNISLFDWTNNLEEIYEKSFALIDVNADIPNDVFVSNKLRHYLAVNRMIMSISREGTASYELLKELKGSVVVCSHSPNDIFEGFKRVSETSWTNSIFKERENILESFKVENAVNLIQGKFDSIIY